VIMSARRRSSMSLFTSVTSRKEKLEILVAFAISVTATVSRHLRRLSSFGDHRSVFASRFRRPSASRHSLLQLRRPSVGIHLSSFGDRQSAFASPFRRPSVGIRHTIFGDRQSAFASSLVTTLRLAAKCLVFFGCRR
jgi:hypothetical protein